jgi:hypothetical protein
LFWLTLHKNDNGTIDDTFFNFVHNMNVLLPMIC